MSTYIISNASASTAIAAFVERGLPGCAPTTVRESGIHIVPLGVAHRGTTEIMQYLHEFAHASYFGKATIGVRNNRNVFKLITSVPVPPPVVMVETKGFSMTDEFKAQGLQEETGLDFPRETMISSNMSYEQLKAVWNLGPDQFGRCVAGNVNPAGLLAFHVAWRMVGIFQMVYGGRTEMAPKVVQLWTQDGINSIPNQKAKWIGGSTEVKIYELDGTERAQELGQGLDSANLEPLIAPIRSIHKASNYTSELKSFPSTMALKGKVFPYFHGMLIPEKHMAFEIFARYFSRCLADTPSGVASLLPTLRKGFRALATCRQGMELQHLFFGIQGAVETGSLFRVIVERGVYRGFVLFGENFGVSVNGQLEQASEPSEVQKAIQSLDEHSRAVERIVEILNGLALKDGGAFALVDKEKVRTSSRYVANQLHRRCITGSENEEELKAEVKNLRYGDTYWAISAENTVRIFDCILVGEISEEEPYFLGGELWNSDNKIARLLTVFGAQAPTINISTGDKSISIPPADKEDTVLGNKEVLPYIPIYKRAVLEAAVRWQSIQSSHSFRVAAAKKKGTGKVFDRSKDVGCVSGTAMNLFFQKLKVYAYATPIGKRARDERVPKPGDEETRVAKKRREMTTVASLL